MTEEQKAACDRVFNRQYNWYEIDQIHETFVDGFQAAQTPEMLMLNPLVKGLVEAAKKSFDKTGWEHLHKALAPLKEGE